MYHRDVGILDDLTKKILKQFLTVPLYRVMPISKMVCSHNKPRNPKTIISLIIIGIFILETNVLVDEG